MRLHALALLGLARLRVIGRARIVLGGLLGHDALLLLPPAEECHARSDAGGAREHTSLNPGSYDANPGPAMCGSAHKPKIGSCWRWPPTFDGDAHLTFARWVGSSGGSSGGLLELEPSWPARVSLGP